MEYFAAETWKCRGCEITFTMDWALSKRKCPICNSTNIGSTGTILVTRDVVENKLKELKWNLKI
jgi:hypothetical protein